MIADSRAYVMGFTGFPHATSTDAVVDAWQVIAIAETAWPAEPVDSPYPDNIPATELTQQEYVERLLDDCDELSASFVCWFFTRDFDDSWESDYQYYPNADIIRLWKDCGLYDGEGEERPALTSWRSVLEK